MAVDTRAIQLRGVRVHNLKGVNLDIPLHKLVAFSGVSGSGKSSLAFDTLYAEGQRRYVETFSAYTRQFLERLDKPDADRIDGIPPAIAVAQRTGGRRSGRSTVATVAEVHDHFALLYARLGKVTCLVCGRIVEPSDPSTVVRAIANWPDGTRYLVGFPLDLRPDSDLASLAEALREDGFSRVRVNGVVVRIEDGPIPADSLGAGVDVVIDRLTRGSEASNRRLDSIETAFAKGLGRCRIIAEATGEAFTFFRKRRCGGCGTDYRDPDPRLFRYNSPLGACPTCQGFGSVTDLDLDKIFPDRSKTIRDGAIAPWNTEKAGRELAHLVARGPALGVPVDVPVAALTPDQFTTLVEGNGRGFAGIRGFFKMLEAKIYKMHVRIFLSRYRSYRTCPDCVGGRLQPLALAVKVGGLDVAALSRLTVGAARDFLAGVAEGEGANPVGRRVLDQARGRIEALWQIGLEYLPLDRPARTLSAGEARRLALATALGSGLVNTLYVLDEPSVGLHPRDVGRLVATLEGLRDAGNSVVVVEHEEAILRAADWLVDVGPGAGDAGGRILYEGVPAGAGAVAESATGAFLSGRARISIPEKRRDPTAKGQLTLRGASGHNLRDLDVAFPLGVLCVVTGVSGAGKSSLIDETLYPALVKVLRDESIPGLPFVEVAGHEGLGDVVLIDQAPIGRSSRSNPITYLKAFDEIRQLFAGTHEAKTRNFTASKFSFNVEGGRCGVCEGAGDLTVDMQFLADVRTRCPECHGTRYRAEVLEVRFRDKTIAEVLELTAREAFSFFRNQPKALAKLRPMLDVGLEYLRLGQPATTLSGGEAQRLKLASFLASTPAAMTRAARGPKTLFLLDEPTTGLHPADVAKLLETLTRLLDLGHSLILVEHAPDILRAADWIIDLGPEAGAGGGRIVAAGTPETVSQTSTHTGRALDEILHLRNRPESGS